VTSRTVFPARVKAVLFDMDGVLIHSEKIWHALLLAAADVFGGRRMTWEEFIPTFGQGVDADIAQFGYRCTPAQLERFFAENFVHHLPSVESPPEALTLLQQLRAHGIRTAVVTNSMKDIAQQVLEQAGLASWLDFVSCADQVPRPKPAPDVVLAALSALRIEPQDAAMVGDSRFDRGAANAAQVRFAGLRTEGDVRLENLGQLWAHLNPSDVPGSSGTSKGP